MCYWHGKVLKRNVAIDLTVNRENALKLMKKFIFQQSKEAPLQIKSVIVPESAKGFIYIESFKRTHVKQAVEGINALRPGVYDQQMVPNTEMKDVLRVIKTQAALKVPFLSFLSGFYLIKILGGHVGENEARNLQRRFGASRLC